MRNVLDDLSEGASTLLYVVACAVLIAPVVLVAMVLFGALTPPSFWRAAGTLVGVLVGN